MNQALLQYLACPQCGGDLVVSDQQTSDGAILQGTLTCKPGGHTYPIVRGVPRLNEDLAADQLTNVARTFAFEWKAHHRGEFEDKTLFGRTREEDWEMVLAGMRISERDVQGAVVLDAGCGSGRFCQLFAEHGASLVIGSDINEAIDDAARYCADYPNIELVQANILAPPFKAGSFGLVWCNGVIHHTPDPLRAHGALARLVKLGGILYVWVYPKRFSPFNLVKRMFDLIGVTRLSPSVLQRLANTMAYPSVVLLWAYRLIRSAPGLRPRSKWGVRTVRPRTVKEMRLTWFDTISPEFDSLHTEEEVVGWFKREGFDNISVLDEPKIGVRGVAPAQPARDAA